MRTHNGRRNAMGRFLNYNRRIEAISAWRRRAAYVTKPGGGCECLRIARSQPYSAKLVEITFAITARGYCPDTLSSSKSPSISQYLFIRILILEGR